MYYYKNLYGARLLGHPVDYAGHKERNHLKFVKVRNCTNDETELVYRATQDGNFVCA